MRLIKTLMIIMSSFLIQNLAFSKDEKKDLPRFISDSIKCLQLMPLTTSNSSSLTPPYLAEVNCGFGQTCPDGYKCCRGTAHFFCCPKNKTCDETDDDCKSTNTVN